MTRGEKIAWIWVWGAIAIVSVALAVTALRYWSLPFTYFDTHLCGGLNGPDATLACERVVANEQAPVELRSTALRRLADMAGKQPEIVVERLTSLIQLGTANAEDWNNRGWSYYTLRNYDKAAKDFEQAALMNKAVGVYWANLADAQIELKKYAEAIQNYTAAMQNGNETAEVLGNRGWARYQRDQFEEAQRDYDKALAMDAGHADNFNERGLVRHAVQDYRAAITDFDQALKLKQDNAVILTNRAMSYSRLGESDKARQDIDRAIGLDPNYESARVEKAWLLIDENQPESALAELQTIERSAPLTVSALEARGRAHLDLGDWQDTIADADRALALGSTYDWPYEYRAKARRGLGDYEGSIADITVLVTRNPKKVGPLATRAIALQLAGRTQAALAEMSRAIKEDIDPAYAYEIRSYLNLRSGHVDEAVADARQSVVLAPQSSHSAATLGWALLEDQQPAAAIRECSRSLTIELSAGAYSCRALAQLALQKPEAALADAQLALRLDKHAGVAHTALGRIDLAQGRAARAMERFNQALKFDAFNRTEIFMYRGDAERALGHVENARSDYETARKLDTGLHGPALGERLAKLTGQ